MTVHTQSVALSRTVAASADEVYGAFTSAASLREWLCADVQADVRAGGRLYLFWENGYSASGEFREVRHQRRLVFSWWGRGEPWETEVDVKLSEADGATTISLNHTGLGESAEWERAIAEIAEGWEQALENLAALLEQGIDLRLAARPMFGLNGGHDLTPSEVDAQGLPISSGLVIEGLMEQMGAAQAGLQAGDVLVELDGEQISGFRDISPVLGRHRAGDSIPASFYRSGQIQRADVTLSKRPLPETPASRAALLDRMRRAYAELDAHLAALADEVSEGQADWRPTAEVWSAKEILAHIIVTERVIHVWLMQVRTAGGPPPFPGNDQSIIGPFVERYPQARDLIAEARASCALTLALVERMPEAFLDRPHGRSRVALQLLDLPEHTREHIAEVRTVLAASRS